MTEFVEPKSKGRSSTKPRVLIVGSVVPAPNRGGGCLALYRHFCEHNDFEISVASPDPKSGVDFPLFQIRHPLIMALANKPRLARFVLNCLYLRQGRPLSRGLVNFARKWKPNLIFAVADDLYSQQGLELARTLRIPFVINFQDLFACSSFTPYSQRPYVLVRGLLLSRYRQLAQLSDAVFFTSDGMRQWFGSPGKGEVLYPLGGSFSPLMPARPSPVGRKLALTYAGNCYGSYGRMVLRLAYCLMNHPSISFAVYAMGNDWDDQDLRVLTRHCVYRGFLPFDELRKHLVDSDVFLTVMSFEDKDQLFVKTSFTTKWLDYVPCKRPIIVWAPQGSTAACFALETGAGLLVDSPKPEVVVTSLEILANDPRVWERLAVSAWQVSTNQLSSERLHDLFRARLSGLVHQNAS